VNLISAFDVFWSIILVLIFLAYSRSRTSKFIDKQPAYRYHTTGLLIKLGGATAFCLIYALYYKGGDTVNYYKGVYAMWTVFLHSPFSYFEILFSQDVSFIWSTFLKVNEVPPVYMLKDPRTFNVIKISSVLGLPGLGGFLSTTLLVAFFTYRWVWQLYLFMVDRYPTMVKKINWCILFLPSTVFWGSGIMKDTYTFAASLYAVYGLHQFFIERRRLTSTMVQLVIAFYLIFTIKSYIAFALLPGLLIFANFERVKRIKSSFVKIIALPALFFVGFLLLNTLFIDFDEVFGKYSADRLLEEAAVQNADLQRDVYGSNSFDIGEFEPTMQGAFSKFFPALNAALFRPFIWEAGGSPTMIFSGLETIVILFFAIKVLFRGPVSFFRKIFSDPFLIFCLLFTIILGFGVGLSTSNFGALVRYKIPYLPFFVFLIIACGKRYN
jgi:hypothetical protein